MNIIIKTVAAAAMFSTAAFAADSVNFDQNIDIKGVLDTAKQSETISESVPAVKGFSTYSSDCYTFSFKDGDPLLSPKVVLASTETREECFPVPAPTPNNPGGMTQNCHQVPGMTYREAVQVQIMQNRKLNPWETEQFTVCYQWPWKRVTGIKAAYKYSVKENGDVFEATPGDRTPMDPDANGLQGVVSANGRKVKLSMTDKWASYYPGEKVTVSAKLKKDIPIWADSTIEEKEVTFDTASSYEIVFDSQDVEEGEYYVVYRFTRTGNVSTNNQVKAPESNHINIQ